MSPDIEHVNVRRRASASQLQSQELERAAEKAGHVRIARVARLEEVHGPAASFEATNDFVHVRVARLSLAGRLQTEVSQPLRRDRPPGHAAGRTGAANATSFSARARLRRVSSKVART